ncbi:hypothetical protein pipiens_013265 [Culex pipiens pipiens]|uniref:Uncharacterized protein n=1 Tax=Culex pipiens pipiens TaxID=38569 RepID=A0ABD1CZA9_CULPP
MKTAKLQPHKDKKINFKCHNCSNGIILGGCSTRSVCWIDWDAVNILVQCRSIPDSYTRCWSWANRVLALLHHHKVSSTGSAIEVELFLEYDLCGVVFDYETDPLSVLEQLFQTSNVLGLSAWIIVLFDRQIIPQTLLSKLVTVGTDLLLDRTESETEFWFFKSLHSASYADDILPQVIVSEPFASHPKVIFDVFGPVNISLGRPTLLAAIFGKGQPVLISTLPHHRFQTSASSMALWTHAKTSSNGLRYAVLYTTQVVKNSSSNSTYHG